MVQFARTARFNPSDFTSDFMNLLSIFIAKNFKTVSFQKSWAPKININNTRVVFILFEEKASKKKERERSNAFNSQQKESIENYLPRTEEKKEKLK